MILLQGREKHEGHIGQDFMILEKSLLAKENQRNKPKSKPHGYFHYDYYDKVGKPYSVIYG